MTTRIPMRLPASKQRDMASAALNTVIQKGPIIRCVKVMVDHPVKVARRGSFGCLQQVHGCVLTRWCVQWILVSFFCVAQCWRNLIVSALKSAARRFPLVRIQVVFFRSQGETRWRNTTTLPLSCVLWVVMNGWPSSFTPSNWVEKLSLSLLVCHIRTRTLHAHSGKCILPFPLLSRLPMASG